MAMAAMAAVLYGGMWLYFVRRNKNRLAGNEDYKMEGKSEQEIAEMGDESPRFIYTI